MRTPPDIEVCVEEVGEKISLVNASDRLHSYSISSLILGKSRYGSLGSLQACQQIVQSFRSSSKKVFKI